MKRALPLALLASLASSGAAVASRAALPAPGPTHAPGPVPRPVDRCAPAAVRDAMLAAAAAVPSGPDAQAQRAAARADAFRAAAAGCVTTRLTWAASAPDDATTWARATGEIAAYLDALWRSGVLLGTKADTAYFARCDRSTMTQNDLDNGRLICVFGGALVTPADFAIARVNVATAAAKP